MPKSRGLLLLLCITGYIGVCRAEEHIQILKGHESRAEGQRRFHTNLPPAALTQPRPHSRPPLHHPDVSYAREALSPRPLQSPPSHDEGRFMRKVVEREERGGGGGERFSKQDSGGSGDPGGTTNHTEGSGRGRRGEGGRGGGGGSKEVKAGVDNVLAALVGFSHDPTLWHFVHSVVDELDYSRRASSRSPPQHHPSVSHLPDTRLPESHRSFWHSWSKGDREEKTESSKENKATRSHPDSTSTRDDNIRRDHPTADHLKGSHGGKSTSSTPHSPTFIFHKVYLNTRYDTHTRQPYHRPVLAVAAVANDTATPRPTPDADDPEPRPRELPERLETFTGVEENDPDEVKGHGSEGVWREIKEKEREKEEEEDSRGRDARHSKGLDTFKGQLKFLKRWEQRLWRRSFLHRAHHLSSRRNAPPSEAPGDSFIGREASVEDEGRTSEIL